jgi:type II secretory pathway pseudopilin PulG
MRATESVGPVRHAQRGFGYLLLLFALAALGLLLAGTGQTWHTAAQREKEAELLFIGHQFRDAIAKYYAAGGAAFQYPRELRDLVDDDRSPVTRHFLRRIYLDPMSGKDDWQLIKTDDGLIIGVASSSVATPIKKANFNQDDAAFENKQCYCDWVFFYQPRRDGSVRQPLPALDGTLLNTP